LTEINKNREILNNPKILENEFKITCYLIKEDNRKSEEKKIFLYYLNQLTSFFM